MFSIDTNENIPIHTLTEANNVITLDASTSTLNGEEVGATTGVHRYTFTRDRNIPIITDPGTLLTIEAGNNVEKISGSWNKSINNNGWNASVRSTETFDASEVFAVSWDVDQDINWTRIMCGLTNYSSGDSYNKLAVGLYQVNNYLYNFYYKLGKATHNEELDVDNRTVSPGDRFVLSVSSGQVKFYIRKNGIQYYMGTLNSFISGTVQFMAAFNRGKNKTGTTTFTNAYVHTGMTTDTVTYKVEGVASDLISVDDRELLLDLGFVTSSGSTYSQLQLTRNSSSAYLSGGVETNCQIIHEYFGNSRQLISNI